MLHSEGIRRLGGRGTCVGLIVVASSVVLAAPAAAVVHSKELSAPSPPAAGHYSIQLSGREVPEGGDPDGQGAAKLDLNPQQETACFSISWSGLRGEVTALHLHQAAQGNEGPHWIDFFNNQHFPGSNSMASGCVPAARDKINAVINNPSAYYLNLHSTAFEKGALRGQLTP
jgi:hypothetical protein